MSSIFFDYLHEDNLYLLNNIPNNIENLIIFYLSTSNSTINNLPIDIKNIIIFHCSCLDNNEDLINNTEDLEKLVFTKLPFNCKIHLLNKWNADIIKWSNDTYSKFITPSNKEIMYSLEHINERYDFFNEFDLEYYKVKDGWNKEQINKNLNYYKMRKIFEEYTKRHLYYKLPNNFIITDIIIYDTQLNLTQDYDDDDGKYVDIEYKRNIKIYTENFNNDIYIVFALDDIEVIEFGITKEDYDFYYIIPNEFFKEEIKKT